MIALVIVSHSPVIAEGTRELAGEMAQGRVPVLAAGGVDDTTIGTNAERIHDALQTALRTSEAALILVDLGSAGMSAQVAIELLDSADQTRVRISGAPLVEGTILAAIEAAAGKSLDEVNAAAEASIHLPKVP